MVEKKYTSMLCGTLKNQPRKRPCATLGKQVPHGGDENNDNSLKFRRLRHPVGAEIYVWLRHLRHLRRPRRGQARWCRKNKNPIKNPTHTPMHSQKNPTRGSATCAPRYRRK
jgi:hypothetical protein